MASAFGHAAAALGLSQLGFLSKPNTQLIVLGVFFSVLPDLDSVGFYAGISYNSFWGHRGFSHSIFFAFIISLFVALFFRFEPNTRQQSFLFLFFSCLSHSLLDALTTGGLGVAFFSPFENSRYFFPFRPIKVSPMSIASFFQGKGLLVIKSELIWIGIPSIIMVIGGQLWRRRR